MNQKNIPSQPDPYSSVWVSYSSISDFLACPRAYYLRNVYRDPKTGHKMTLMSPSLALGQAVHDTLEQISQIPRDRRMEEPLISRFEAVWNNVRGEKGGFFDDATENRYKERGISMISRVIKNPGPISKLAVKIKEDLPHYFLSEEEKIILCGKVDWLEFFEDTKTVHIIDFKTGRRDEDPKSLQFPIYYLVVSHAQKYPVSKASYWYLERNDEPTEVKIPDEKDAYATVLKIAKEIKLARALNRFKCPQPGGSCSACKQYEAILRGEATMVGSDKYGNDSYVLHRAGSDSEESVIL